jgi:non-ribosomal peptide synthetase component F
VVANRQNRELEGLIGFFVNTLLLRVDLEGNPTFLELLEQVRQTAMEAYAYQDLPFERLVEELQPERTLSHGPLFQVLFTFMSTPLDLILPLPGGLIARRTDIDVQTSKRDLTLRIIEQPGQGLSGFFEYNTDLFDASTIRRLCQQFERLLQAIALQPQPTIDQLGITREDTSQEDNEHRSLQSAKLKKALQQKPRAINLAIPLPVKENDPSA